MVSWLDRVAEDGLVFIGVRRVRRWFGHGRVQAKLLPGEDKRWEVMHSGVYYFWGVVSLLLAPLRPSQRTVGQEDALPPPVGVLTRVRGSSKDLPSPSGPRKGGGARRSA